MEYAKVACRLPCGFIFQYPSSDEEVRRTQPQIKLNGANRSPEAISMEKHDRVILDESFYGVTMVPRDIWDEIVRTHPASWPPFASDSIFEIKSKKDGDAKVKDLVNGKKKTGFEGMSEPTNQGDGLKKFKSND